MHSSSIVTLFTLAMAVVAVPTGHGGSGGGAPTCSTSAVNKCCNGFSQETIGGVLSTIGLGCTNIIGATCTSGTAACCNTQQEGLLNLEVCNLL